MKLKYKIAIIFTMLSVISIIMISSMLFNYGKEIIEKKTIEHLVNTNNLKSEQLDLWIDHLSRSIISLSEMEFMKRDLKEIMGNQVLKEKNREKFISTIIPFVKETFFAALFLVDEKTGQVIYSSDIVQEGKFKDNQPFFKNGRDETFVQDIMFDVANRTPFMIMSVPIKDRNGRTTAILAGKTDLLGLSDFMENWNNQNGTEDSFLVNKFKYYVTEPRFAKGYALRKTYNNQGLRRAKKNGTFLGTSLDYRGKLVICAIKYMKKWNLSIITKIDMEESLEPIQALKRSVFGVSALIAFLSAVLGFFLSFELTKPLEILSSAANRIGEGDLDLEVNIKGKGEFYDVAKSFMKMASELKSTMVSKKVLEEEVQERRRVEKNLKKIMGDLQQSNEDLQQFAYVASHDLQEPLRMVSSFTQLLSERYRDELDEKAQRWINFAVDGANRMQNLIQDLLSFSRVSTHGKEFSEIDMEKTIEKVLNNLSLTIEETGAEISYGKQPKINADESQMIQLLQNLIANGIKFVKEKKPEIRIKAVKEENRWVFSVSDNGIGIEEDYYKKIFIIFQRLHTRDEFQGTGLGLAVCKRILQRHGGDIWVESKIGEGTTFYFTIPATTKEV